MDDDRQKGEEGVPGVATIRPLDGQHPVKRHRTVPTKAEGDGGQSGNAENGEHGTERGAEPAPGAPSTASLG